MNAVLKIFLSMSVSGGLLILVLLLGKQLLKDKISRQWQYYIWLVVVLRLLLPFGPEANLLGKTYQAVDQAVTRAAPLPQPALGAPGGNPTPAVDLGQNSENTSRPAENLTAAHPLQDIWTLLINHVWLVWLAAALGLLIRKVTIYQGFLRYIHAGLTPVSDIGMLDRLSAAAERAGVRQPVELCVNPLISSPLLIGFFHPCIVLPGAEFGEKDFQYIVLHELTHYKRRDMFYKWLVQVTACLHWFNPLVHLMSREITKACEFSCDEAVLAKMGYDYAQDYGKTLLDAMAAVGKYKENLGSVTLSENKQLLKERLEAIMRFRKKSTAVRLLTGALTLCVMFGAAFVGVYPAVAAGVPNLTDVEKRLLSRSDDLPEIETLEIKGTTYYLVQNEAQLRAIGAYGMDRNYMQQADIQLSADEWTPIGTWDHPFTGTFNGNGFEIRGLTMTDPDAELVGLFGVAKDHAQIYNITLRDYDIASAGKNAAGKSVGAIVAVAYGGRSYDNTVYPRETDNGALSQTEQYADSRTLSRIENYYEAGSLPLFQIAFSRLDEEAQGKWLDRIYADEEIAFLGAVVNLLDEDCASIRHLAETIYEDGNTAFFAALAMQMSEDTLEAWLDRALEDGNWAFQSMLFILLDRDDEFDVLKEQQEREWAEAQKAEYGAVGVTMDGKDYYYQGKLVNVFLDIRSNKSFYTLNMNPKGTVNIKIVRDADNKITGAAYMTEAELTELFGDMDDAGVEIIPVDLKTVGAGKTVFLGEYTLSEGDKIRYDISAETGSGMQVFFAEDEQKDAVYWSVHNLRQQGEPLKCTADFTVKPPAKPGKYKLFIRAADGALGNVKGSISLSLAAAS